ncbi:endonuclease/exonuclease/phosphatase family protein [Amycolatopsis arida]|uniref:endonuclease/exonuclease/phosphatase family protein n=1 Tax=Amycolatopsis arida TaxID=587909 RepID=UPI0014170A56|nr:endonuclease/exonuclease/phosphatase family protein [Amycolatopsis arida]
MRAVLSVGTWNIARLGWSPGKGHHRLAAALEWLLAQTPVPPDVLGLPEGTHCLRDGQRVLRRDVVARLSTALRHGWYEPFVSVRPGHRNHPVLLVNTAVVRPLEWHDPQAADVPLRRQGFLIADIHGVETALCCEHWQGGLGRTAFDQAANRLATWGRTAALIVGDFNATSGWYREHLPTDWFKVCARRGELHKIEQKAWHNPATGRWKIDTRQLDKLRTLYGFRDMGEQAGDPTVTTSPDADGVGLRIDRIFRGAGLSAAVDAYRVVQPPPELSDHAYVHGAYRLTRRV